jgi:hypothetical protein
MLILKFIYYIFDKKLDFLIFQIFFDDMIPGFGYSEFYAYKIAQKHIFFKNFIQDLLQLKI